MTTTPLARLLGTLVLAGLLAAGGAARAESSIASSLSKSVSASVGSVSDSVQRSSGSSGGDTKVAEGDYRLVQVAELAERPGMRRLTLQALAAPAATDAELYLWVPAATVERNGLAAGQTVSAHERPYGYEFAVADTRQAFFLVLQDAWYRDLQTTAVSL